MPLSDVHMCRKLVVNMENVSVRIQGIEANVVE